jgi:cytoskeletal protein CcmA (bactofilin family)
VIGADLRITGGLESKGEVQIDGQVGGDIRAQRIVIGEPKHL